MNQESTEMKQRWGPDSKTNAERRWKGNDKEPIQSNSIGPSQTPYGEDTQTIVMA